MIGYPSSPKKTLLNAAVWADEAADFNKEKVSRIEKELAGAKAALIEAEQLAKSYREAAELLKE